MRQQLRLRLFELLPWDVQCRKHVNRGPRAVAEPPHYSQPSPSHRAAAPAPAHHRLSRHTAHTTQQPTVHACARAETGTHICNSGGHIMSNTCKSCRVCSSGDYQVSPCTSTSNRVCAPRPPPPPPSPAPPPPKTFLNLHYDAYSSANSHNGRSAGCIPSFDAGDLDTEIKWTKLAWFNEDLLQIDALDTTYAITVSGSGKLLYSAPTVASAHDCAGGGSTRGEGVIDLRGTPYVIAGVSDTPCYQTNSGGTTSTCFQWKTHGWYAAVRVTCSHGNQRCVIRCGGGCGTCKPINNILQLAWA